MEHSPTRTCAFRASSASYAQHRRAASSAHHLHQRHLAIIGIAPLLASGPSPPRRPHDHPRLWLLGALSSQKVRLSLCSAADCAKHIELTIRRAAHAARRGVSEPEECLRNALPRARACVPHGATPDPLERLVKTVLFFEFWRGWGRKPSYYQRPRSSACAFPGGLLFAVLSSLWLP